MAGTSPNAILKIVKGVAKTPRDTATNEQGLDEIDLLDPAGFSCDEYDIQLPNMKSSAVWSDSPQSDGRTLIAGTLGNVKETIRLNLTAGTIVQLAAMLSKLNRFRQDCNDFWDTVGQIEPVYIKHQVEGEPGSRYALLYDIGIEIETSVDPGDASRAVILRIEREYGWRGIAPGDNPKKWTCYVRGQAYTSANAGLTTGSDHLVSTTVSNRREWNAGQTALLSQNFFDIPANLIPGDLDALVCMAVTPTGALGRLYYGRTSKPDLTSNGATRKPTYTLNAGDALVGTDTSLAADTGAPIGGAGATNQRAATTFATVTTDTNRVTWTSSSRGLFDFSTMRGRYAIFARARLSAASTVALHLRITAGVSISVDTPTVNLTDVGSSGTGNTTDWGLVYMGTLAFPLSEPRVATNDNGLGVTVLTSTIDYTIAIYAARTGGATNLYVSDLIFIPIDETGGVIDPGSGNGTALSVTDNTGYFLHGRPEPHAHVNGVVEGVQLNGSPLTLKPGIQNRIILFGDNSGIPPGSVVSGSYAVRLNIVPRWAGLRDS